MLHGPSEYDGKFPEYYPAYVINRNSTKTSLKFYLILTFIDRVMYRLNKVIHHYKMTMIMIQWQNSMMKKIEVDLRKMDLLLANMDAVTNKIIN